MDNQEYNDKYKVEEMSEEVKRYCKAAVQVQDACNLSGVVFDFAKAMHAVCEDDRRLNKGTDWKNQHPIAVLFASKIASLTRCEYDVTPFYRAFNLCDRIVKAEGE
jgi:hypothetical protein